MIRVLVVDDHPIVRAGIVGLLGAADDIQVVGEAGDGHHAVELAADLSPDVVLMDLRMPQLDGVAATAQILAAAGSVGGASSGGTGPTVRVLIVTTYESDDQILGAIEAGASGYLLKAAPQAEIIEGVRQVARGQSVLSPSIAAKLVQRVRADAPAAPRLSARELDVLRLVATGQSNAAIGRSLFIGEATVKTHLLHAFEKLDVNDRTRAVTRAMELGLLSVGSTRDHPPTL
ncbi:response regulator [Glaciibacter psychrotolerans]|uniref:DNA-binding NarL/FixJ family response regulator n=1 Tax=Glaciibacter psychrotolerans TaxID=670054 RepID=A0A7Z0EFH7_9MICO|nr:response regulator transcription factor [Leifsonia psychrotolerans]NYJ20679.1 DNA-binding NarL/FixJ family response regulator [Leifsonia psychrotolerans]